VKGENMNSKWHLYISVAKSIIRILACIMAIKTNSLWDLAIGFGITEGLGILEEIKDNR
jgi:hypothetical protein